MSLVRLLEADPAALALALTADVTFERFGVRVPEEHREWLRAGMVQTEAFFRAVPRSSPWGAYLVVDRALSRVVGTCAFKSGPSAEGNIEIAYGTLPTCEGKGYATAAARELIRIARSSPMVRCVLAHTLPEHNGSCRVLEKNGMACVGEVIDPEDGSVWRWELMVK